MPGADLASFRKAPVGYADELVLLRIMLRELRAPALSEDGDWCQGTARLVPECLASFWSAHSHRSISSVVESS